MCHEALAGFAKDSIDYGMADEATEIQHWNIESVVQLDDFGRQVLVRDLVVDWYGLGHLELPYSLKGKDVQALKDESA